MVRLWLITMTDDAGVEYLTRNFARPRPRPNNHADSTKTSETVIVATSTDKTFRYYRWEDIAGKEFNDLLTIVN